MTRLGMTPGTIVVVSLHEPREKYWGVLVQMMLAGIVVRGMDVNAFADWLEQEAHGAEKALSPSTVFFPMGRVERVEVDEAAGPIPGLADAFRERTRKDPVRALGFAPPRRPKARR